MAAPRPGALIGDRFALGELLGVGGTGSVFAATDATGDLVGAAVKLLHPHLCADAASRDAFLREAQLAMRLQHPNIVRVHAAGLHDAGGVTMPWIALERLHGPTLREWVGEAGPLPVSSAAAVIDGVLAGLSAAHSAGLVHRDISPQNIILSGADGGQAGVPIAADAVRILDFGLADVTGRATVGSNVLLAGGDVGAGGAGDGRGAGDGGDAGGGGDGGLQVVGNAHFMSPEQAQGLPVRSVSDLYQAGAVLHYALTGQAPFPRASTAQVMQAHLSAPPPVPSALVPAARPLDRIVTRAMSKTPAHRFRTAEEFRTVLHEATSALAGAGADAGTGADSDVGQATSATTVMPPEADVELDYLSPAVIRDERPATAARTNSAAALAGVSVVVLIAIIVGGALLAGLTGAPADAGATPRVSGTASASPPSVEPTQPPATRPPATAPSSAEPPPAVMRIDAPTLFGTLADARATLAAAGLGLGTVTRVESAEAADRVLAQQPAPGTSLESGTPVDVTIASGRNTVPQVAGMSVSAATAVLRSAGFLVAAGADPAATVSRSDPAAGAVLTVGVTLTLYPVDTPTPHPTQTSDPTDPGEER